MGFVDGPFRSVGVEQHEGGPETLLAVALRPADGHHPADRLLVHLGRKLANFLISLEQMLPASTDQQFLRFHALRRAGPGFRALGGIRLHGPAILQGRVITRKRHTANFREGHGNKIITKAYF